MPALANARHERFARELAKGVSATDAMKAAGYSDPRNSTRLTKNNEIRRRVDELQGRAAEKAEWTAADRLKALKGIFDRTKDKDPKTAISSIAEANKMQGSYAPAKHQHSGPNGGPIPTVDLTNMDADDLDRLEAIFGPLAGSAGDDVADDPGGEGTAGG